MKKPSRFLRLLGVASLLATLLAGVFATSITYAQPDPDPSDEGTIGDIWDTTIEPGINEGAGSIFFPWVGNDDESTGLGAADTSVSVMNISDDPAVAFAWVGSHDSAELPDTGGWDIVGPFFLAPYASKTFTAAQLGIAEGTGAPVSFTGYNALYTEGETVVCETVLGGPLEPGNDVNGNGECTDVEVLISGDDPGEVYDCAVDDANGDPAPTVGGDGLNADGDCVDAEGGDLVIGGDPVVIPTVLGGYAKQAVDGENLPYTTAADSSVSGYNSIGGFELIEFDDWYFPIAQTNCGPGGCWNTILRIANFGNVVDGEVGNIGSAAVTAAFFPADDAQGSLDTGFQLQALINTGDVWNIDISDYVPEGWVGSVHVYSDSAIFAMADRVKVGYGAWITNTASNAPHTVDNNVAGSLGQYVLFAPDVRIDFFGWNTGINVANLVNQDNNVNIQYFNMFGNAPQALTRRLAPQGMTYFYDPSQAPQDGSVQDPTADVNADIIGSALVWSDYPVAVAVDATKYPESTTSDDPNIFQAMSYSATANVYTTQAFPLVQKGNPTDGMGATSGINIMNPNNVAAQATVWWINPSGFGASNFGNSAVAVPAFANGFVYTMTQGNLPNGFYGSAVLASTVPVSAVTTQVDYQVEWDGTAVWLGYNPCGYYRDNGADDTVLAGDGYAVDSNCNFGDPFNTSGGSIKKLFVNEIGEPVVGATVTLMNEAYYQQNVEGNESFAGIPWVSTDNRSDINGEILWTNVPAGTYYLLVNELNAGSNWHNFWDGDEWCNVDCLEGPFTLNEGQDLVIQNDVERWLPYKVVYLDGNLAGMEICLHPDLDDDGEFDPVEAEDPVQCQMASAWLLDPNYTQNTFWNLEPGGYWITVNGGFEYDVVDGYDSPVLTAYDYFELGYWYVNDYSGQILPHPTKTVLLPGALDGAEVCLIEDADGDGSLDAEEEATFTCAQATLNVGTAEATITVPAGSYFIVVNGGYEFPTIVGYASPLIVDGPENFVNGESYTNDYTDQGTQGTLQKVLTLPEFLMDALDNGDATMTGIITFFGPAGFEVEGNVQTVFEDLIGPNDEPSFSITDADVPVGGPYEIDEFIEITWDDDGDPLTPPVVFTIDQLIDATDRQVVCDDYLDLTSTCEASPDAPAIMVYEDQVTRVFNDLAVGGQLDVFVRDELTDLPLADAEVCLFSADNVLIDCVITDATGIASFTDVPDGVYTVNAAADGYESDASTFTYSVGDDAANPAGPGLVDTDEASADVVSALDPAGAILDVLVTFLDGVTPAAGASVAISPATATDIAGPGGTCTNAPTALAVTDAAGEVDFGVVANTDYCVIALFGVESVVASPVQVPPADPAGDVDATLSFGFNAVINVNVTASAADLDQSGVHPVSIHVADAADVAGDGGTCAGALVVSGATTSTGVGTGTFTADVGAGGTFCVAASSADGLGNDPTVVTGIGVPPGGVADVPVTTS